MITEEDCVDPASLQKFGRMVLQVLELFCNQEWQYASKKVQKKYIQYSLSHSELEQRETAHDAILGLGNRISIESLIEHVLLPLGCPEELFADDWDDNPDKADKLLEFASFAISLLGGGSCLADLEFYISNLHLHNEFPADVIPPKDMLLRYKRGEPAVMTMYLNNLLRSASNAMRLLAKKGEVKGVWYSDSNRQALIDLQVLNTSYYLCSSLLRLVESTHGNC